MFYVIICKALLYTKMTEIYNFFNFSYKKYKNNNT